MLRSHRLSEHPKLCIAATDKSQVIVLGAIGDHVAALQDLLVDLGAEMPRSRRAGKFDGIFGEETKRKICDFQARMGLKADGMVGPRTLAAMDELILSHPRLDRPGEGDIAKQRGRDLQHRYRHLD